MCEEVLDLLNPKKGQTILDCTVGGGGHASMILERILPGRLIGLDQDEEALSVAKDLLSKFDSASYSLIHENYRNIDNIFSRDNIDKVDGVLFDLGISSFQLDNARRGFSIKGDGPLDMRMDKRSSLTAYDLVNRMRVDEIENILRSFGEERYARRIARSIGEIRKRTPIATTGQLREIVERSTPAKYKRYKIHPATRTFLALRIAVNHELEHLEYALEIAIKHLAVGGRICVISFHSLEDRIAKNEFRRFKQSKILKVLTKKPLRPSHRETIENPRSRSAKLRAAEKIKSEDEPENII
ncbi:MAG: 16S rRNA (cytosine(1402)-N(4))-methyltransferase RsmH [Candidatus Omnitrophica bacterium]|nr:16S rRNA (cytosine(1402)-N(4))-methyltransferase RsmH [Candidatus Omnitrophota bacterium]